MTQTYEDKTQESSNEIKADIERTRNAMSNKIDRIQERVSPENLKQQAQETVRTVMNEGTDAVVGYVRGHASDVGGSIVDAIKSNPVPAALIGLGVGWFLYNNLNSQAHQNGGRDRRYAPTADYAGRYAYDSGYGSNYSGQSSYSPGGYAQQSSSYEMRSDHNGSGFVDKVRQGAEQVAGAVSNTVNQVTDKVQEVGSQVGDQVSHLGQQTQHLGEQTRNGARQIGGQAQHVIEREPLGLGLAALAIGAAIGLTLPATRRESQFMGEWRDQVVNKAQTVASDVKQRVQEVVEEVKPELQAVAGMVVEDVKETGKAAFSEAKDVVKRVGTTAQDKIGETISTSFGSDKQEESKSEQSSF